MASKPRASGRHPAKILAPDTDVLTEKPLSLSDIDALRRHTADCALLHKMAPTFIETVSKPFDWMTPMDWANVKVDELDRSNSLPGQPFLSAAQASVAKWAVPPAYLTA